MDPTGGGLYDKPPPPIPPVEFWRAKEEKQNMKSAIKYLLMVVGGLLGLVLLAMIVLSIIAQNRLNRRYEIFVDPITIPDGKIERARGEHLVRAVSACTSCHGPDLGGQPFIDEPIVGQIYAPNLTSGVGGKASQFDSEDWVRVLRHGVDPTGRPLLFMPAQHFRYYSDTDLGAIITYILSAPPVNRETPPRRLSLTGRILFTLGAFGEMPVELIDHRNEPPAPRPEDASPDYGEFLIIVGTCKDCHGENLAGGRAGPDDPFAPNLTPGGELVGWTEEDFFTLIRTGVHPSGRSIDPTMPWQFFRHMTDTELRAIWAHLQRLPAHQTNGE
jgi:mono/diheme cytochrome c family protein